jgi:hypothetical protein
MSSRTDAGRAERIARLSADRQLLAVEHPYLEFALDPQAGTASAHGAVPMLLPDGRVDPIAIRLDFHARYPTSPPLVAATAGRFQPDLDRHVLEGGQFCLYLRDIDEPNLRRAEALHVFMLDIIVFLDQQLIFERTGRFPGPGWPHGMSAYSLYVVEQLERESPGAAERLWKAARGSQPARNAPCSCGSGAKYKRCHLLLVTEIARIATRHDFSHYTYDELASQARAAA